MGGEPNPAPIAALLGSYPRVRPPLPPAHARIHLQEYRRNRGGADGALFRVTAALEAWMHRRVACGNGGGPVLELGAGTLNHLPYEPDGPYDIVEPWPELYQDNEAYRRVTGTFADIAEIPPDRRYCRIISVAVLEHVEDLPRVVARSALLLQRDGVFQAGIPSEGGLLWGLAWRLTTGIAYRLRTGLPYGPVMRHEHVNSAADIIAIVRHCFRSVEVSWFPLPVRPASFYCYVQAREPLVKRCGRLLALPTGMP